VDKDNRRSSSRLLIFAPSSVVLIPFTVKIVYPFDEHSWAKVTHGKNKVTRMKIANLFLFNWVITLVW
jgi:hypothetical protein